MKYLLTSLFLCLSFYIVKAQDSIPKIEKLPLKTVKVVDSIVVENVAGDSTKTMIAIITSDSVVDRFKDMEIARNMDSLWLYELYNNERFEEMYGSIINQDFEPVPYEELSTDVLKQRLKELNARTPFTRKLLCICGCTDSPPV